MIVVIKAPHWMVPTAIFDHVCIADSGSIQPTPILHFSVFMCNETNTTSTGANTWWPNRRAYLSLSSSIRGACPHHHPLDSEPKLWNPMDATHNFIHYCWSKGQPEWLVPLLFSCYVGRCCMMSFAAKRHNSTTSQSYWELYIWIYCS